MARKNRRKKKNAARLKRAQKKRAKQKRRHRPSSREARARDYIDQLERAFFGEQYPELHSTEDNSYYYPHNEYGTFYSDADFIKDMKKYQFKKGYPVDYINYDGNLGYAYMSPEQLDYYFYWRTMAREGYLYSASLNYYLLYLFELINLIEIKIPKLAYEKIIDLYDAILSEEQDFELTSKGETLLAQSIFDFALLNKLDLRKLNPRIYLYLDNYERSILAAQRIGQTGGFVLPLELIDTLTAFELKKSHYLEFSSVGFRNAVTNSVYLLDELSRIKTGESLFDNMQFNYPLERYLRPYTYIPTNPETYRLFEVKIELNFTRLNEFLAGVIQEVENAFRTVRGERGKLRKESLPDEMKETIHDFISNYFDSFEGEIYNTNPAKSYLRKYLKSLEEPELDLDTNKIDLLRSETEVVKELLEVEEIEEEDPLRFVEPLSLVLSNLAKSSPESLVSLETLVESELELSKAEALKLSLAKEEGRFLMNPVLETKDNQVKVRDEYQPSLKYILGNKEKYPFLTHQSQNESELEEFINSLGETERKFLSILIKEENPNPSLENLAEKEMTMVELIFDDINNSALLFLDDILLEMKDGLTPVIIEEYKNEVKEILDRRDFE